MGKMFFNESETVTKIGTVKLNWLENQGYIACIIKIYMKGWMSGNVHVNEIQEEIH